MSTKMSGLRSTPVFKVYFGGTGVTSLTEGGVVIGNGEEAVDCITGSDGQVLTWSDTSGSWVAADPTGGSGGSGGSANNANNANNLGGVTSSLYARKDTSNTFQQQNVFQNGVAITSGNLGLIMNPSTLKSGDLIVQGGQITNFGGDIAAVGGGNVFVGQTGKFIGSGEGITDLTASNWVDGEEKFIEDIRNLFTAGEGINYDPETGIIENQINAADYLPLVDAESDYARLAVSNEFTQPQLITTDNDFGPLLTVENLLDPEHTFIVNYSGNVGIRTQPKQADSNYDPTPFALNINNSIYQENVTKGIIQDGTHGPIILRNPGGEEFDLGLDNTGYKTFGKYGLWALPDELTFSIPDLGIDPADAPEYKWFRFKVCNRYGPAGTILSIKNTGETILNGTLTINGDIISNGNFNINGGIDADSFTGSFSGSAEGIYGLTGSMWTGASSFADDVRAQLNAGAGMNYDPDTGTIIWTGLSSAGLVSKNNITGSGLYGEEFDLVDDITVNSVTAYLSGTAEHSENSDLLNGFTDTDFAKLDDSNTFNGDINAQDISGEIITANVGFSGPGTGITGLSASNWDGLEPAFISDVRNQISAVHPIDYNSSTGVVSYLGVDLSNLYTGSNLEGLGIYVDPVRLKDNISLTSVTARLYGTADTALNANNATLSQNSLKLGNVLASDFPRKSVPNIFTDPNRFQELTASFFSGNGSGITNITASNIQNFFSDVKSALVAGPGIILNSVGDKMHITASGGGGGGGETSGSIEGKGIIGDEIRLKDDIEVVSVTAENVSTETVIFNVKTSSSKTGKTLEYDPQSAFLNYNIDDTYSFNIGQQSVIKAYPSAGTIAKGKLVSFSGTSASGIPRVQLSSYLTESVCNKCIGMSLDNFSSAGLVLTNGVIYGINTAAYSAGTVLYLSSSGDFTNTKPSYPEYVLPIGMVVESAVDGAVYIKIENNQNYINNLHDVNVDTAQEGELFAWDDTQERWINTTTLNNDYEISGALNIDQSLTVNDSITSSNGFFCSDPNNVSQIKVVYAQSAGFTLDPGAVRTYQDNNFEVVSTNTFNGETIFNGKTTFNDEVELFGSTTFQNLTASSALFTGPDITFDYNIIVQDGLECSSLTSSYVSSSYITSSYMSSSYITASILLCSDVTADSLTSSYLTTTELTASSLSSSYITASHLNASYIYGDGSNITNINAQTATNNLISITTTNIVGSINSGSCVSFSGSYLCSCDNTDERRSNFVGVVLEKTSNNYKIATTGIVSASAGEVFIGGDVVYIGSDGALVSYNSISRGKNATQVGIASFDVGTSGNIILQPRIFGIK